jgi:hypothetical protein
LNDEEWKADIDQCRGRIARFGTRGEHGRIG